MTPTPNYAAIAAWAIMGAVGITLLCFACWRLSVWAWKTRPDDDIAPGVPTTRKSLHEKRRGW